MAAVGRPRLITGDMIREGATVIDVGMNRTGDGVAFELTDERLDGDELLAEHGFELLVEAGLQGTVDVVEPHDRLILRPPGDPERSVREPH